MVQNQCTENELRVVLLGRKGSGKSKLVDNIISSNADDLLHSDLSTSSVERKSVCRSETNLTIVDTPGFKADKKHDENLESCLLNTRPGPHAFLICIRVGRRTKEIEEMLDEYVRYFGEKIYGFTIFIFTHVDQWNRDREERGQATDFQQYIDVLPGYIKNKMQRTNTTYYTINNRLTGAENEEQIENLIDKINEFVLKNNKQYFERENAMTSIWKWIHWIKLIKWREWIKWPTTFYFKNRAHDKNMITNK